MRLEDLGFCFYIDRQLQPAFQFFPGFLVASCPCEHIPELGQRGGDALLVIYAFAELQRSFKALHRFGKPVPFLVDHPEISTASESRFLFLWITPRSFTMRASPETCPRTRYASRLLDRKSTRLNSSHIP